MRTTPSLRSGLPRSPPAGCQICDQQQRPQENDHGPNDHPGRTPEVIAADPDHPLEEGGAQQEKDDADTDQPAANPNIARPAGRKRSRQVTATSPSFRIP